MIGKRLTTVDFVQYSTVQLISTNASDEAVARAAWVSNYGEEARTKETGRMEGLINYLYKNQHMSPFEHGIFTFFIDTPIFVARELFRHRTGSFNEVSGRYTELKPRFYIPGPERPLIQQGKVGEYTFVPGSDEQYAEMKVLQESVCQSAWMVYQRQLELGIAKEVARDILPLSTMTQFYISIDPRNLMHAMSLRSAPNALWEIRGVSDDMKRIFKDTMPLTYNAFVAAEKDN